MSLSPAPSAKGPYSGGVAGHQSFDSLWAQMVLTGIVICLCNAIVYYPLRLGLYTPPLLVPSCFLIFSTALLGPLLLPYRGLFADARTRSATMPLASLLILAGLLLAFLLGPFLLAAFVVLFIAGARRALQLLKNESRLQLGFCIIVGLVVGLYLFCTVQSANYAGLYTPEESLLGLLNHDTSFHTAITYTIQNFGVPSTALDGIVPIKYHFGSHFWFAALGKMTHSKPLFSYGAGVPIVLAPMLVVAFLLSAMSIGRGQKPFVTYLLAGLGMIFLSDLIGWNSYYISEAYGFALIGLLLLLPLLAVLAEGAAAPKHMTAALVIALAAIPLLFVLKVSIGALWAVALGWTVLRRFGLSAQGLSACLVAGVLLIGISLALAPSVHDFRATDSHLIVPFYFFRLFPAAGLACFLIPLALMLSKTRVYGGEGLGATVLQKSDLMFEAAMVVMIAGAIPPLLGTPQDSALWYFLNVAQWVAMALLVARFAPGAQGLSQKTLLARALPVVVAAGLGSLTLMTGVYKQVTSIVMAADAKDEGRLLQGEGALRYFRETLAREHVLWGTALHDVVAAGPGAQLVRTVRTEFPKPDRTAAVFIPPENTKFWNLFSGPRCLDKYNVQVSMTGQPSLLGGPPDSYGCGLDAYTSEYGTHFLSRTISDADLCRHARERDIQRVLIVAESHASYHNRILNCIAKD